MKNNTRERLHVTLIILFVVACIINLLKFGPMPWVMKDLGLFPWKVYAVYILPALVACFAAISVTSLYLEYLLTRERGDDAEDDEEDEDEDEEFNS